MSIIIQVVECFLLDYCMLDSILVITKCWPTGPNNLYARNSEVSAMGNGQWAMGNGQWVGFLKALYALPRCEFDLSEPCLSLQAAGLPSEAC
jgi:hypothetical protein